MLPIGYHLNWAGQYEYLQRAKARLTLLIPLTLLLIAFLLFIHSRNIIEVLIIMGTVPLSFVGGIWFMYWLNYNLSVAAGVGFIALAGVAVETGMVMLNYLNLALKEKQCDNQITNKSFSRDDLVDVIYTGALRRIRPIMMAIAATFAGLVPVMIASGTGSEVMRRIAAPMVGGLLSATVLTLIIIPIIYYLWKQRLIKP